MKNGKLFGKLNIIDLLVIVIVIAALAFVGYKFLKPDAATGENAPTVSTPNLRFEVRCEDLPAQLQDSILAAIDGDSRTVNGISASPRRIYNSSKLLDAQIVGEPRVEDGVMIFTVEARVDLNSGAYTIGTQEIRCGNKYILKTTEFEMEGIVVAMEIIK